MHRPLLALLVLPGIAFPQGAPAPAAPAPEPPADATVIAEALVDIEDGVEIVVDSSTRVSLHGFAGIDYGFGDRFSEAVGEDEFGPSKAALETDVEHGNLKLVAVIGGTIVSDQPVDTGFKDIFIVWKEIAGSPYSARAGAQATLFGLKPAGYPGDRSLQPSIEFGGAGAFAVSNQAGPSLIVERPLGELGRLEVGVFDTDATTTGTAGSLEGSGLYKNYFAQARLEHLGPEGLYGIVGYEGRYVGQTSAGARVDSTEPIFDVGVGYANERLDVSLELVSLDESIAETADTETYYVAELTLFLDERVTAIADYATADELENSTLRLGGIYDANEHLAFQLELAYDEIAGASDVRSVQMRATFGF